MRYGTCHFVSLAAARRYYAQTGETARDVDRKITEGSIRIGPPELGAGDKLSVIPGEGRYQIEEAPRHG